MTNRWAAVSLVPKNDPDRGHHLNTLAVFLRDQYQRLNNLQDLENAVKTGREAVELTPIGHPSRALCLQNLAEEFRTKDCLAAYSAAFRLLPEILWIGHSVSVRHDAIHRLDIGPATSAAVRICLALSEVTSAVRIMEQGLATVLQQMLQLKGDHGLAPAQAEELRNLSSQLYSGSPKNPMQVVNDRKKLLGKIRTEPGQEFFLLPKPYHSLGAAAQGGPVVILNSHERSCDAIIILDPTSEPVHVALPNVTLALLESHQALLKALLGRCNVRFRGESSATRLFGNQETFSSKTPQECFEDMLRWLSASLTTPVYEVLKSHGIVNGRLWWLPTGAFTGLPIHASSPTDKFVHSYTATLGSIIDANARGPSTASYKVGVVGVTHTGLRHENSLIGVGREVKKIVSIIKQPHIDCLEGEQATVAAVKHQLQECSWVHLACHGKQNLGDPTKSCLSLYGGTLDLDTILRMRLSNAQFVFLAACQTAMGDAELVNESFHLGGGFIAAGFRGTIGTMWSMNDADGPLVAEIVYSHLFRDGRDPDARDAAEGLHLAVKELRKKKVAYERWIPFIHMGLWKYIHSRVHELHVGCGMMIGQHHGTAMDHGHGPSNTAISTFMAKTNAPRAHTPLNPRPELHLLEFQPNPSGDVWFLLFDEELRDFLTAFRRHLNSVSLDGFSCVQVSVDHPTGPFYMPKQRSVEHIAHLHEVFDCSGLSSEARIKGNQQILSPFSRYHQTPRQI
ncbi:CHAT domain-containing protein [Mycena vulgaris]|nr:CHAT domain-containing protein [Mycena vulgaris]